MENNRDYFNALLQALHFKQMVEEACDGNAVNNHFRKTLTVDDCLFSFKAAQMWTRYAVEYCRTSEAVIMLNSLYGKHAANTKFSMPNVELLQ